MLPSADTFPSLQERPAGKGFIPRDTPEESLTLSRKAGEEEAAKWRTKQYCNPYNLVGRGHEGMWGDQINSFMPIPPSMTG